MCIQMTISNLDKSSRMLTFLPISLILWHASQHLSLATWSYHVQQRTHAALSAWCIAISSWHKDRTNYERLCIMLLEMC